jgi:hypothetical protein
MKAIVLSLALAVLAGGAQAQITGAQILATFQQQGFTRIEVQSLGSTIKVEAVKNGMQVEVIYDTATGKIVKQDSHPVGHASGSHGSDDGAGHDAGDDHGSGGHGADNSGSGRHGSGGHGSGRHGADD